MLHLVTGTPGASKTAFVVTQLDKLERSNFVNVRKNKIIFEHNLNLFEKFKDEFSYYEYEEGSGSELKIIIEPLPDDYFLFLKEDFEDLRPDDYFKKTTRYNEIVDRINDLNGLQKFELLQPVRTIYTNIKACKIPYSRSLIHDWRDAPDGSLIVIDEIQLVEPYKNKKSEDPMIMGLTIHRHRGFDFYIITQATRYLHPAVKELIGCHYHITRPFGWTPKVYQYGSARDNPNALINKLNTEAKFSFKPADRIFTLYKSTTINTHKKRIPKFIYIIAAFVICMGFLFYHFASKDNLIVDRVTGKNKNAQPASTSTSTSISTGAAALDLSQECRKAVNLEKPECVKFFDELSKNKSSVTESGQVVQTVSYNPDKPYDFDYKPQVQPTDFPKMSGVVKLSSGKLVAIDQQGNYMTNISQSDCKKWLSGYRPFNYFKQQQSQQTVSQEKTVEKQDVNKTELVKESKTEKAVSGELSALKKEENSI